MTTALSISGAVHFPPLPLHSRDDGAVIVPAAGGVLELIDRFKLAENARNDAADIAEQIHIAALEAFPPRPPHLTVRQKDGMVRDLDEYDIERWINVQRPMIPRDLLQERAERMLSDLREHEGKCDLVLRARGWNEAAERKAALQAQCDEILDQIRRTPAYSFAELAAKMRLADEFDSFTEDADEPKCPYVAPKLLSSVLEDLDRLQAETSIGFV